MVTFVGMFEDKIPFLDLPVFHQLIHDYLANISGEVELPPYPELGDFLHPKQEHCDRELLVASLLEQNKSVDLDEKSLNNINKLRQENTFTITTGHQLCLLTGPMYFVNKICATIAFAKKLKERYPQNNYVPVFWLASEDHDLEEVNHFYVFGKKQTWETNQKGAVGRMNTKGIVALLDSVTQALNLSERGQAFVEMAKQAYHQSNLSDATRLLVSKLFEGTGLVIIDGDDAKLKRAMIPYFQDELINNTSFQAVSNTNNKFKKAGYKIQVNPREINLFYLTENNRLRIVATTTGYELLHSEKKFSREEMLEELENHPENFSPNVLLRPLYQEVVLPNLAYIGGGGEISYWLQIQTLFQEYEVRFPALLVRDSAVFVSQKTKALLDQRKLSWVDMFKKDDQLIKEIAQEESTMDFEAYHKEINTIYDQLENQVAKSVVSTIQVEKNKALKGLKNIEKRTLRSIKAKNEIEIKRVLKAKSQIFPSGKLQERIANYLELLIIFDNSLIPLMIETMNPLEKSFHFYYQK